MRLLLLLLLFAVAAQAGLFEIGKIKDWITRSLTEKIKDNLEKALNKSGIFSASTKLYGLKKKLMTKLKLSKEQETEVKRKMKEIEARRDDTVEDLKDSIFEINADKNVGKMLFQSDIILTKRQAEEIIDDVEGNGGRARRQAFKDESYPNTTWEQGVFYWFDDSADYAVKKAFEKGAKQWQDVSCIDFKEDKSKKAPNGIVVIKEDGCWSYVGRAGGEQPLSLGDGCQEVGIAAHELGHALGLFHTMSRYDRDQFITVVLENSLPDFVDQYVKETEDATDNYATTYDYGSIMHYGAASASQNKKPTMVASDVKYQETMGSQILSFLDKSMINDHYKCKDKCPAATSAKCQNGGFPHPRKCSTCICPSGYGGDLCNERPSGCGQVLQAKEKKQFIVDKLGFSSDARDEFIFCNYWIEAPEGKKIEIKINSISHGYAYDGCVIGGVEIKSNKDQIKTGYRFCSPNDRNTILISETNRVPVITFNRAGQMQTILEYKLVP